MSVGACKSCGNRRKLVGMLVDTRNGTEHALCGDCTSNALGRDGLYLLRASLREEPPPHTDGDYVVPFGMHKGVPLKYLSARDLEWYAAKYYGKDKVLKACAQAVLDDIEPPPDVARVDHDDESTGEAICAGDPVDYGDS